MGRLGNFVRSLAPGNDHELAATRYAGRPSASDRSARRRRESYHSKGIARSEKAARKWEAADRRRFGEK